MVISLIKFKHSNLASLASWLSKPFVASGAFRAVASLGNVDISYA